MPSESPTRDDLDPVPVRRRRRRRRPRTRPSAGLIGLGVVLVLVAAACTAVPGPTASGVTPGEDLEGHIPFDRDLRPYAGLGAWVDVFDYAPAYQDGGAAPTLSVDDIDDMARRGVRTLFLQATRWDSRSPAGIVDADLIAAWLARAHDHGIRVVGWYLPRLADVDLDVARTRQILEFSRHGERFDGLAVDIEYTEAEPDPATRNTNLVAYSQRVRTDAGSVPVAAVVLSPVHLEVVNDRFWPDFPYRDLRSSYDVWIPMAYWTVRTGPWRDPYRYVTESIARLRANLGEPPVLVAAAGGIADETTDADLVAFARAVRDSGSVGGSIYDWSTTSPGQQALIQRLFTTGPAAGLPPPLPAR